MIEAIILAAGKGTRMRSHLPKVLHPIGGTSMLEHVLSAAREIDVEKTHLVLGHGADAIKQTVSDVDINCIIQSHQLGTGHAVLQAVPHLSKDSTVIILFGDVPLISPSTLNQLLQFVDDSSMALLTVDANDPSGYGRVIRNPSNTVVAIVEDKDASDEQRLISEVNTGIMAVKAEDLSEWLPRVSNNNAQGEYYLPDIVALAVEDGKQVNAVKAENEMEVTGVNNRMQQAQLERFFQLQRARELMNNGVTICDPTRFDLRGSLNTGEDCIIDINCLFEGQVTLGNDVQIGANCCIKNATILDGTEIKPNSIIEGSTIDQGCIVGPFARVRPGSVLKQNSKVGNFVETKKTVLGEGSKINHLSYVGDAEVGSNVNIGAGTITCNYDGVNKSKTVLGNNVFIGSNTALVAPVKVENGATVGAGSTITQDIKENQLAVARNRQRNIDGWNRPTKK